MRMYLAIICAVALFSSCEGFLFDGDPAADPEAVFEALWKEVDEGYSFFEFKQIDWDSVYQEFRPRVNANTTTLELFEICSDMLYSLRDGHVNISSGFNLSRNWEWFLGYPSNYDAALIQRNYLKDEQWYTGPLVHAFLDSLTGYLRYSSFGAAFSESQLDLVLLRFQNTKGLIIDVRDNGGGSVNLINRLASRFADQERLAYNFVVKTGPGHGEFSDLVPVNIKPGGEKQYTKPVIILTNRSCYSATNTFVAVMKSFPHVKVVGDWTGGGGGVPVGWEMPNGWTVRYSATQSFLPDGFNIEGGIPPDIRVDMSEEDRLNGVDTILERAWEELK